MKGSFFSSALLSCLVFSGLTLPLAALGSKSVGIEFQRENIFAGRLKDIASPYLAIAGLVSLGTGLVSFSVAEWHRSTRKSTQIEQRLFELQQELKEKSHQIDELRLSESYLVGNGLHSFVESGVCPSDLQSDLQALETLKPVSASCQENKPVLSEIPAELPDTEQVAQPTGIEVPVEVLKTLLVEMQSKQVTNDANSWAPGQKKTPISATPQTVSAFASEVTAKQPLPRLISEQQEINDPKASALLQVSALQKQIKQIETHIEALQNSLQTSVSSYPLEVVTPTDRSIEQLHQRLHLLELDWLRQQQAS